MTRRLTLPALADRLLADSNPRRRLVAIAGAPGSGKSTAAEALAARLNAAHRGCAAIVPMDGFHFDDAVLEARGDRARKGAPHTFDLDGFQTMLARLRRDDARDIAVPLFDRAIETARAAARIVEAPARIVLVEGNYLLLDAPGWRDLGALFDLTVMIDEPESVLVARLEKRWRDLGFAPAAIAAKLDGNDLPNMRLVLAHSRPADVMLRGDA